MPNKRTYKHVKRDAVEGVTPKDVEKVEEIPTPASDVINDARERIFCGHQNLHYTEGELKCTLEKGHGGDHQALLNNVWTAWSDAAGIPPRHHA